MTEEDTSLTHQSPLSPASDCDDDCLGYNYIDYGCEWNSEEELCERQFTYEGVEAYIDWFAEYLIRSSHPEFWIPNAKYHTMNMSVDKVPEAVVQRIMKQLLASMEVLDHETTVFRGDGDLQFHPYLELTAGTTLPVEGFLSTSSSDTIAKTFIEYKNFYLKRNCHPRLLQIVVPTGSHVIVVNHHYKTCEDETILYRGQLQLLDCQLVTGLMYQNNPNSIITYQLWRCRYIDHDKFD